MRCHTQFTVSLHFILLILVLGVVIDWSEGGRLLRAWRRNGNGPNRNGRSPWSLFHTHRRSFLGGRRRLPPIHHLRQELAGAAARHSQELTGGAEERRAFAGHDGKVLGEASLLKPIDPSTAFSWKPMPTDAAKVAAAAAPQQRSLFPYINAVGRNPTFDYVPPSSEQVKFVSETRRAGPGRPPRPQRPFRMRPPGFRPRARRPPPPQRFQWNRRKTQYTREPPLIWKLLASRRNRWRNRWNRPPPRRPGPNGSQETNLPHIVFFQHEDMMLPKNSSINITVSDNSTSTSSSNSAKLLRPGKVASVPLYPREPSAPSEFIPIPSATPGKEYIFRVVELKHLKKSTTTPKSTSAPAYKSVPTPPPFEPMPTTTTEQVKEMEVDPPAPIENVEINIDAQAEGSDHFLQVVHPPSTTLTPIFALREEPAYVEEIIVPRTSAEEKVKLQKPGFQSFIPTYKSNKKSTGLTPKGKSSKEKEWRESKEEIGSSIMITGIRSKVKEYKPQMLANFSQLIAFDKVITPVQVVEIMAEPVASKLIQEFSGRSNTDEVYETTVASTDAEASEAESQVNPTQAEVVAEPDKMNSTVRVSISSSESVSISNSNSPSINQVKVDDSESTATTEESPMERFDPMKLIHSWFMKT